MSTVRAVLRAMSIVRAVLRAMSTVRPVLRSMSTVTAVLRAMSTVRAVLCAMCEQQKKPDDNSQFPPCQAVTLYVIERMFCIIFKVTAADDLQFLLVLFRLVLFRLYIIFSSNLI